MSEAQLNAKKIAAILEAGHGQADLYRTVMAGPSGQRRDLCVGRVRYLEFGPDEFEIRDHRDGELAGYARRDRGEWSITEVGYDGTLSWLGYATYILASFAKSERNVSQSRSFPTGPEITS